MGEDKNTIESEILRST